MAILSCNENNVEQVGSVIDSTSVKEELLSSEVDAMSEVINQISMCMDSISIQENIIYKMSEEGGDKQKILDQLHLFKDLLANKQSQINALTKNTKTLADSDKKTIQNLQKIVLYFEQQLDEKTDHIAKLEESLSKKDAKIDELRYSVNELNSESEYLKEQNYQQDKQLNTVYSMIATKKELKESGILKSNLFTKKINNDNVDSNLFKKLDKRYCQKIIIDSNSPKILSNNPSSSYILTKNEDGTSILEITNVEMFWSISPYLIIQK